MTRYLPFILLLFFCVVACQQQPAATSAIDRRVDSLLSIMTLEEKIGQLTLYTSSWAVTGPTMDDNYLEYVRKGQCGNVFNAHTAEYTRKLQKIAVEETRLHIPLLFGYDVIHGYKTIFPIPLAEACSWDTVVIQENARLAAKEAASAGLHWTFNPMVDISRDPRWGRIAESSGEDPYLGSLIAKAKVRGYQGDNLSNPETVLACVKHFAAYGAAQAGRDYHTVDMSERVLRETYLPPYKAAVDAGAETIMTSFNEIDGIPSTANRKLFTDILRDEWGFDGFVVTDYTAINEMIQHGYSKDLKQAAEQSINAGVDMDMQGGAFLENIEALLKEGKVTEETINEAVRRILRAKFKLGLFEDPYRYSDGDREKNTVLSQEMKDHARVAGKKSIVLLKNEPVGNSKLLPLKNQKKIAVIGPLGQNQIDMLGTWHASGVASEVITIVDALKQRFPEATITFEEGCKTQGDDRTGIAKAVSLAKSADIVIMTIGEDYTQSGEAASRSQIGLPGVQSELLQAVHATGKPIVAVLMAGRPLTIPWMADNIPAIVNAWHLGTAAGLAIVDVLSGDYNPSGKLVATFPRNTGQIPIYYSMKHTGRPFDANNKYTSKYLDVSNEPMYPFGFGLSYSTFEYSDLKVNAAEITTADRLTVTVTITNSSDVAGEETTQLYVQDLFGSVTRPVKELKSYQKVMLQPGESKTLTFVITNDDLKFFDKDMKWTSEPGDFKVYVGGSSADVLEASFKLN